METTNLNRGMHPSVLILIVLLFAACEPTQETGSVMTPQNAASDNAAFVTRLGADTLVVEQFTRTPTRMEADVVIRTPRTRVRHYVFETDDTGAMTRYEATVRDPAAAADAAPLRHDVATIEGDSLVLIIEQDGETQRRAVAGHSGMLPFVDMVHWPFELMLSRAYASGADSVTQDLFTGGRNLPFVVRRIGADSMTAQHPFRGTMGVDVDEAGRLVFLDAGATTRKLKVERVASVDVEGLATMFAARDAAGRSFGALSGRGAANATVHGATIAVDYGTPVKRGREIFGALVPYGERWRTGANRATHFTTDRDLTVAGLDVPAGEYTLSTILAEDGGTLIINTQTGQGGTTYNQDRDLGRVALTRSSLDETVEVFTIVVEEMDEGGVLKLQWDRTEFSVPFTVKG